MGLADLWGSGSPGGGFGGMCLGVFRGVVGGLVW